jgi:hypothetical protein
MVWALYPETNQRTLEVSTSPSATDDLVTAQSLTQTPGNRLALRSRLTLGMGRREALRPPLGSEPQPRAGC